MVHNTKFGKLVFDLNGEYAVRSQGNYGIADIDDDVVRENLVYYSDRKIDENYKSKMQFRGKVRINMLKNLSVGDILNFGTGFSEVMKSFLLFLDGEGVSDFLENLGKYVGDPSSIHRKYPDFWGQAKANGKEDRSARKTLAAIQKRVRNLLDDSLHDENSKMVQEIFQDLKKGKVVIIDLSLKDNREASIISTIIVRKLFESNKRNHTSQEASEIIPAVICVEEAQNVLSDEYVRTNANPFVRVAKEGRKFDLGMIAVTQRPSAISEEIRTQTENFFAFYMGNTDDIRALIKSNINYDGVIAKFLQRETIRGNLYMVTSKQSFVVPMRVNWFEELIHDRVYPELKFDFKKQAK